MRKLILWSMAVCLAFALAPSAPALADDGGVINHGLLGVHPDIQGEVDGILQVTTVHEEEEGEGGEGGYYSNWIPSWGANPWSSDGEKIVYQSARIDPDTGWQQYEICTMNADGTDWQQLTNNSRCDSHASFVPPNNEKIVFQRNVNQGDEGEWGPWDGQGEIWIMDADGSNQISLTQQRGGPVEEGSCENKPVVSPDGSLIAFRTCGGELWVMDINGNLLFPFPVSGEYRTHHHVWSPDPELPVIVFSGSQGWGDSRIYAVLLDDEFGPDGPEINGGGGDFQPLGLAPIEPFLPIIRISPPDEEVPFDNWCENWPSVKLFDMDGDFPFPFPVIAYHGRYQGYNVEGENPYGDSEVHRIVLAGGFGIQITVAEHYEGDGTPWSKIQGPTSWFPGDFFGIAYVAEEGGGGDFGPLFVEEGDEGDIGELPYPQQSLFVVVEGDGLQSIQLTAGYQDTRPWWSPDGGKILFKENHDGWWWDEFSTSRDGDTNPDHRDLLVLFFGGEMPAQNGSLTVTIEPEEARTAGAQWRVDGGAWQNSGDTVHDLPVGQYLVEFRPIAGWDTPASQNVDVEAGQTASTLGAYVEQVTVSGDVNGDGQVTPTDLRIIRAIMGTCVGNPRYIPAADMDNSGCINTVDINLWYKAYNAYRTGQN